GGDPTKGLGLNGASTLEIRHDPGNTQSPLNVEGGVSLGGALLGSSSSFNIPPGTTVTLLDDLTSGAVGGAFGNAAQGGIFLLGGQSFVVDYAGGDGNDVTLTARNDIV